ncbi:MAG: hypothetical protein ACYCO0_02770 [Candidatus Micrarchaeaceae archaeon]
MKQDKKRKRPAIKMKTADLVIAIFGLMLLLIIIYAVFQQRGTNPPVCVGADCIGNATKPVMIAISNINQSDVNNVTGINYTAILVNDTTTPSPSLKAQGFESISVSAFNYNETMPLNVTYPKTIVAILYATKNSTMANQTIDSALLPAGDQMKFVIINSSDSSSNVTRPQNRTLQYYYYAGHKIGIYSSFVIAVFNESGISYAYQMPIYRYVSAFSYNGIAGIVTTGGYISIRPYVSVDLAKALFRKIIQS